MDYKKAILSIVQRRKSTLADFELALEQTIQHIPELKSLDSKIKELVLSQAMGKPTDNALLARLKSDKAEALKNLGLDKAPPPTCAVCSDKGLHNGKPCVCAISAAINSSTEIGIPLHDFSFLNFKLFDEVSRPRVKKVYADIELITKSYPKTKKSVAVIMGSTGTGKTYLAGCAANEMLKGGFSVVALSAFALNDRFLKYHTTFDGTKADCLDPILDCDLLVIDDLGTESILKNVTMEYLYLIINERTVKRKLTVITTNLAPDSLLSRYGARIYSRIFDKSLSYPTILTGKDLRSSNE